MRASLPRGPRADRGALAERILAGARRAFAEAGYAGTSLSSIARDAGVDPRLVAYYFTDKPTLFDACLVPPPGFIEGITAVVRTPLRRRGAAIVRYQLAAWDDGERAPILRSILLTAAHEERALRRLQDVYRTGIIGAVAASLDADERLVRAGLVATQLLGLAMTRFVWRIEPIASLAGEDVVALVGPTVQRYLTGRLRDGRAGQSPPDHRSNR